MTDQAVNYSLKDNIALIQMDDGKVNALTHGMLDELDAALTRAEQEAKAIVFTGRAGRFSAGFDLKVMMAGPESANGLLKKGAPFFMRLYGSRLPLVIACSGHAVAGGALITLCGDARIGVEGPFKIGLNETAVGLPLPIIGVELARDRLAKTALSAATLGAFIYDSKSAVKAGYLDQVVDGDALLATAHQTATVLAGYNSMAFYETKKRLRGKTIDYILATLDEDLANFAAAMGPG